MDGTKSRSTLSTADLMRSARTTGTELLPASPGSCSAVKCTGLPSSTRRRRPLSQYISWLDGRSLEEEETGASAYAEMVELLGPRFKSITGMRPRSGFPLMNLTHLARKAHLPRMVSCFPSPAGSQSQPIPNDRGPVATLLHRRSTRRCWQAWLCLTLRHQTLPMNSQMLLKNFLVLRQCWESRLRPR